MTGTGSGIYEQDFDARIHQRPRDLRRLVPERWNGLLGVRHPAEDVAGMGSEILHDMEIQLERIIEHRSIRADLRTGLVPAADLLRSMNRASIRVNLSVPSTDDLIRFAAP